MTGWKLHVGVGPLGLVCVTVSADGQKCGVVVDLLFRLAATQWHYHA